jgi:hypothetical protein
MSDCEGVVDVRCCGVIPGGTGGSASFESPSVVFEVGDDNFHDLRREPASLARVAAGEGALEFGFGTVPNGVGEASYTYG